MPFTIVRQDITKMDTDAIVNAANTELLMGGGVCGAIFNAAGSRELQAACSRLAPIKTGEAVITPGFALPAGYIIHTAGPIYDPKRAKESERLLRAAYMNSLQLALEHQCRSIAFPLISSGIYGYPKGEALSVATAAIKDFLLENEMDIYLAVFDKEAFAISSDLLGEIASYIDEHYVDEHPVYEYQAARRKPSSVERRTFAVRRELSRPFVLAETPAVPIESLDDLIDNLDEPFSETLLRLIDAKGKTDVEVYKRANLDRKLFSKIRTGKGYMPGKRTALALAVALELSLEETDDLLKRAGYALSHSQKFDTIIEYFIISGYYDIFEINKVLFSYDQPLLGG